MNNKVKRIFKIVILCVLICTISFGIYLFVKGEIEKKNTKKISNAVNEVNKERIDYVFVEINPSFVLTIKDNKVNNIACLNDDCLSIYNEINVKGKNIEESIESIYNLSTEKGFDTSKGVKVKVTNGKFSIEEKNYIEVIYINEQEKEELLSNVKNNEDIKEVDNNNYYSNLWEELKKDSKYGKVYNCDMINNELECYIMLETGINKDSDYDMDTQEKQDKVKNKLLTSSKDIYNTLEKFGFTVKSSRVYLNNTWYSYVPLFTLNDKEYKNVLQAPIISKLNNKYCTNGYEQYIENGICKVEDGVSLILLEKLNLVNPILNSDNSINNTLGMKDRIIKQYNASNYFKIENDKCVAEFKNKGYTWKAVPSYEEGKEPEIFYMWCLPNGSCTSGCDPNAYNEE